MESFTEYINEYKNQLKKGAVQKAYRGLMDYMMDLRTQMKNRHPDYFVSGNIYPGYMDMTYFAFTPKTLQSRKLKTAIVFLHEAFRFEIWLAGNNKQIQSKYWRIWRESGWNKYRVVPTTEGVDSILECVLVDNPDFRDMDALTRKIEKSSMNFIQDIEGFLSKR